MPDEFLGQTKPSKYAHFGPVWGHCGWKILPTMAKHSWAWPQRANIWVNLYGLFPVWLIVGN